MTDQALHAGQAGQAGQTDVHIRRWLFYVFTTLASVLGALLLVVAWHTPYYTAVAETATSFFAQPGRMASTALGFTMFLGVLAAVAFSPAGATHRAGVIIMLGIPTCTIAFIAAATPKDAYAGPLLRGVFLATAVVLPAALFFLFIATRRESLLNAYLSNLDRLGLLARRKLGSDGIVALYVPANAQSNYEPESARIHRLRSYLDRFAAVYGRPPDQYVTEIIKATSSTTPMDDRPPLAEIHPTITDFELKTILPVLTATILVVVGWISVFPALGEPPTGGTASNLWWFSPEKITVTGYAFLGAYFFSVQSIGRRYLRRDLGPNAYVSMSMRIILSVIVAWVLTAIWPAESQGGGGSGGKASVIESQVLIATAFVAGIFPYVFWQLLVNTANRATMSVAAIPNLRRGVPLSQLDGLTAWHESRLEEEDIENVANMADADIPDLMLNTKLPPHRIVEWIDQAILYRYVLSEEGLSSKDANSEERKFFNFLTSNGIRNATTLVLASTGTGTNTGTRNRDYLTKAATSGDYMCRVDNLACALQAHPNLAPLMRWKGLGNKVLIEAAPS